MKWNSAAWCVSTTAIVASFLLVGGLSPAQTQVSGSIAPKNTSDQVQPDRAESDDEFSRAMRSAHEQARRLRLRLDTDPEQAHQSPIRSERAPAADVGVSVQLAEGDDPVAVDRARRATFYATLERIEAGEDASAQDFALLREAAETGYLTIWWMFDNRNWAESARLMGQLEAHIRRHSEPTLPPALHLAMARIHWLRARYFSHPDETLSAEQASALRGSAEQAVLRLTENYDVFAPDRADLLRMRIAALWSTRGSNADEAIDEACRLTELAYAARPDGGELRRTVACSVRTAEAARTPDEKAAATASLEQARRNIEGWAANRQAPADRATSLILLTRIELARHDLSFQDPEQQAQMLIRALEFLVRALEFGAYFQNGDDEILGLYRRLSEPDLRVLANSTEPTAQRRAAIASFERLTSALEPTRRIFPQNPPIATVIGDAAGRLSDWYREIGNLSRAEAASDRAMQALAIARPIELMSGFDELAAAECRVYSNRVRIFLDARRSVNALQAYRELSRNCGGWLRRFPWDFYARNNLTASAIRLGRRLHQEHRYEDALPILQYASNWGDRDSTLFLVDMYRHGRGVAVDATRANLLASFAVLQSMKRFTVPTNFAGVSHPFHVYIMEYARGSYCPIQPEPLPENSTCIGFEGIDDQVEWVRQARGGEVPQDVVTSFRRLNQIARENNVSFPDLAVYALGAARQEQTAAAGKSERPPDSGEQGDVSESGAGGGSETPSSAATTAASAPPAATAGPEPQLTTSGSRFFAEDISGAQPVLTETFVVPFRPGTSCFRWSITVDPVDRPVTITEIFDLPAPPRTWGDDPSSHQISENGRRATTTRVQSTEDRVLTRRWCIEEGDPTGVHRFRILHGTRMLYDVEFEILPQS